MGLDAVPEKFQPSEKVTNMNLDKGWKRLEKLLLLLGAPSAAFVVITNDVPKHGEMVAAIFFVVVSFVPWLVAKIIKWIIDGFRD